ncbi:hypothetical protein SGI37_20200, partial [Providencia rettgeri]
MADAIKMKLVEFICLYKGTFMPSFSAIRSIFNFLRFFKIFAVTKFQLSSFNAVGVTRGTHIHT